MLVLQNNSIIHLFVVSIQTQSVSLLLGFEGDPYFNWSRYCWDLRGGGGVVPILSGLATVGIRWWSLRVINTFHIRLDSRMFTLSIYFFNLESSEVRICNFNFQFTNNASLQYESKL